MKYRNTGNEIISTVVKLSFLSMSVMRQIWKARQHSYVRLSIGVACLSVGYVTFAVGWT